MPDELELKQVKKLALAKAHELGHEFDNTNFRNRQPGRGWRIWSGYRRGIANRCKICGKPIIIWRDDTPPHYTRESAWGTALNQRCQ